MWLAYSLDPLKLHTEAGNIGISDLIIIYMTLIYKSHQYIPLSGHNA